MVEDQFALLLAIGLSIIHLKSLSDRKVYIRNLGVPVTMYSYYGSGGSMSKVAGLLTTHTSLSPIRRGFAPDFVDYKKRCIRLTAARDKVYQLLAHGRAESGVKTQKIKKIRK
jgi:hypothetical protein